jgi:hypothetical protein
MTLAEAVEIDATQDATPSTNLTAPEV